MKRLLPLLFLLGACSEQELRFSRIEAARRQVEKIVFVKHETTGFCFAVAEGTVTLVPCRIANGDDLDVDLTIAPNMTTYHHGFIR